MKIAISYFYQVRFFKTYMIPVSTAVWDPKWYHDGRSDQNYVFTDRRGVINGLRISPLMPGRECAHLCRGLESCEVKDPSECLFIKSYSHQLDDIRFDDFMSQLDANITIICGMLNLKEEPVVVFLVHEAPDNSCSERIPLINWFNRNGVHVQELLYPVDQYYA